MYRTIASVIMAAQIFTFSSHAQIQKAICIQIGTARYRIAFTAAPSNEPVQILASSKPDASNAQLVGLATQSPYQVEAGVPGERVYFLLKPAHGKTVEVSIRRLPLQGSRNFRDLGGYQTSSGQAVKWGMIYRADELGGCRA